MDNLANTYQHIADILSFKTSNSELEKALSENSFNWESIVKVGSQHLVIPAIYCRLKSKQLLHYLPKDLINYLDYVTKENRKRNDIVLKQVHSISELLNSKHIDHVFVKGTALLVSGYYEDIAERMLGDIDLLVASHHIDKAYNLLCNDGYIPTKLSLGQNFFEHRHLARLEVTLSSKHIAAVEVHHKLFTSFENKEFNVTSILKEKNRKNGVYIPNDKHLLKHNILNYQINDYGALYNTINFRSTYDTLILQQVNPGMKKWYKKTIYKKYFRYTSLFFEDIKETAEVHPSICTRFYLYKLNHLKFYKNWNKLLKISSFLPLVTKRIWFFISKREYRNAIIRDRRRIFGHFKSIFGDF